MLLDEDRKKLDGIVTQLASQNAPESDVHVIVDDFKKKYDKPAQPAVPQASGNKPPEGVYNRGVSGSLFPRSTLAADRNANLGQSAISATADVLSIPNRAVSAAATGLGTLAGGGSISQAAKEAGKDFGQFRSNKEGAQGLIENAAYDPTLLIPGGAAVKGLSTAGKIAKEVPLGIRLAKTAAGGALTGGASALLQNTGDKDVDLKETAIPAALGAAIPLAGVGASKISKVALSQVKRNLDIKLRPGQFGRKIGYDAANVMKHDLDGKPREIYEKAQEKLDDLQKQAQEVGKNSPETFKTSDWFDSVKGELSPKDNPNGYKKQIEEIDRAKQNYIDAFGENMSAVDAMKARSRIGDDAAFVGRTGGGSKVDPDADWKEELYNKIYAKAKNDLHTKLGKELQDINAAQHEIIPIKAVAERRIPIAESNHRIGLSDLLTTGIGQHLVGGAVGGALGAATPGDRVKNAAEGLAVGASIAGIRRSVGSKAMNKLLYGLGKKEQDRLIQAAEELKQQRYGAKAKADNGVTPEETDKLESPAFNRAGVEPPKPTNDLPKPAGGSNINAKQETPNAKPAEQPAASEPVAAAPAPVPAESQNLGGDREHPEESGSPQEQFSKHQEAIAGLDQEHQRIEQEHKDAIDQLKASSALRQQILDKLNKQGISPSSNVWKYLSGTKNRTAGDNLIKRPEQVNIVLSEIAERSNKARQFGDAQNDPLSFAKFDNDHVVSPDDVMQLIQSGESRSTMNKALNAIENKYQSRLSSIQAEINHRSKRADEIAAQDEPWNHPDITQTSKQEPKFSTETGDLFAGTEAADTRTAEQKAVDAERKRVEDSKKVGAPNTSDLPAFNPPNAEPVDLFKSSPQAKTNAIDRLKSERDELKAQSTQETDRVKKRKLENKLNRIQSYLNSHSAKNITKQDFDSFMKGE